MRTHGLFHWTIGIAASMICILVTIAPISAKSKLIAQNITAVSGTVTGNVQEVGFRAMIQKQAIRYNLGGSAENNSDGSVRFTLQGDNDRIKRALKTIAKGTKKSSNVNVSTSSAAVSQHLETFTVVGWTSVSRGITHPYDLVFPLRNPDTAIKKGEVKAIWLQICESAVKGEDAGKCDIRTMLIDGRSVPPAPVPVGAARCSKQPESRRIRPMTGASFPNSSGSGSSTPIGAPLSSLRPATPRDHAPSYTE